jgi:hypothetical protein
MKEPVPRLKSFKIGEETCDLEYLLNAPFEDIGEAAQRIPAAIGWLGHQRALLVERLIISEQAWKEVEARQYFELKNGDFAAKGFGEKPTEDALKRAILLIPDVRTACEDYAKRKKSVEWATASIEALKAKLDLVRSSEVTRRMEHEPDQNRKTIV